MYQYDDIKDTILRKTHNTSLSAIDFLQIVDNNYVLKVVLTKDDLLQSLEKIKIDESNKSYIFVSSSIQKLYFLLSELEHFKDLSFSLNCISELIKTISINAQLRENCSSKKVNSFVESVLMDLVSWIELIFIDKICVNINYLDSSMMSSFLQFETQLYSVNIDDDDDVDIFF